MKRILNAIDDLDFITKECIQAFSIVVWLLLFPILIMIVGGTLKALYHYFIQFDIFNQIFYILWRGIVLAIIIILFTIFMIGNILLIKEMKKTGE